MVTTFESDLHKNGDVYDFGVGTSIVNLRVKTAKLHWNAASMY